MNCLERKMEFFNGLADTWDKMSPPVSAERMAAIVSLATLKGPSKVLDVGAGTGALIPALLDVIEEDGTIYAIDPAERMLCVLESKFPDKRIKTYSETLEKCSLPDSSVDAVICFSCFPHIADKSKAVSNTYRMLKPRAKFVIAHTSSRNEINHFHAGCSGPVRHDVLPDKDEMKRMLEVSSFEIVHFKDEAGCYELVAQKIGRLFIGALTGFL